MGVPHQAAPAVATSVAASPALWARYAPVCQLTQVEVCVCPRVEEALRKQTRLECSRAICQDLSPGTMALLRVVRATSNLIEQIHDLWTTGLDSQAKVPSVSVRYLQISVLMVARSRCCIKQISVKLMTVAQTMDTHVSVLGWKAGAVALSFATDPSCGCGVTDFPCADSVAPLTAVGVGFGGSGV
jgi:hypothetical protein